MGRKPTNSYPGIREHRGSYQVRYWGPDGRQHAQSFARITDALTFQRNVKADVGRGAWIDPQAGRVLLADYAGDWLRAAGHLRPGTVAKVAGHLRTHVLPAFGPMRLGEIRPVDVRAWVSGMTAAGMAPGTVMAVYRTFAKIMKTATIEELIVRSPCIGVDLPTERHEEMRFLAPGDVERLAHAIDDRYRTLVYFAAYTGLRWGEIAALRVDQLNLLKGTVAVVESQSEISGQLYIVPPKNGRTRVVSLPRSLAAMLEEHLRQYPAAEGRVFSAAEGGPLRRNFYRRHYVPAVARAGLPHRFAAGRAGCSGCGGASAAPIHQGPPVRFHDLRHTCASLLIAQGAHAKEIAERLGHSTVRLTLDRYGHLLPTLDERLRDGLEAMYQAGRPGADSGTDVDQMWTRGALAVVPETEQGPE